MNRRDLSVPLALIVGLQPAPATDFVEVVHQPVACVVADKFPRFEAQLLPADRVGVARLLFQGATPDWYSVSMKREGDHYVAVLPKPRKSLKSVRYYIEVIGQGAQSSRTPEHVASVVRGASECRTGLAGTLATASVLVQAPAGVAALPAGFASNGVIAAGTAAGGTSAGGAGSAGATAAAGGGGIGATALVVGGLAAGGAVAVGVAAKGGSDDGDGDGGNGGNSSDIGLSVMFAPIPGVDVSACGPGLTFFSSQAVPVRNGSFDTTWAPSSPNVIRVTGTASPSSFQATIACTNGARSGTITASGSNYTMSGSFEFGASRGQVSITRQNN